MSGKAARKGVLCRLEDVAVPGSKAFTLGEVDERREIFVVRDATGVYAYDNSCPHTGGLLDWVPGQFLTLDKKLVQCATHGALFRIGDGHCIHGPCVGARLESVRIAVTGNAIVLAD